MSKERAAGNASKRNFIEVRFAPRHTRESSWVVLANFAAPEASTLSINRSGFDVCRLARAPCLFLAPRPQRPMGIARIALERFVAHDRGREFEAYAVWVEE